MGSGCEEIRKLEVLVVAWPEKVAGREFAGGAAAVINGLHAAVKAVVEFGVKERSCRPEEENS